MIMHKIKIVHLIGDLGRGGAERFVVDICNELSRHHQYEVYIISLCENNTASTFVGDITKKVNYLSFHKKRGLDLKVLLSLTRWMRKEQPHIVHSHLNGFEYLFLYQFYKSRTSFFHTLHNIAEAECPYYLLRCFRRFFYNRGSVVPVTISSNGSSSFKHHYHLTNDILIANGRPTLTLTSGYPLVLEQYKGDEQTFVLVHIGRIAMEKNQQLLIAAVQRFNAAEHLKKCRLLIIGEVENEKIYQDLKVQADGDVNIEFIGGKANVADYLTVADAFCLSSLYEGMPISLIEAMSLGCIPVCTPVGGITEMIEEGITGFLSRDTSTDAYYETLKRAVSHCGKKMIRENAISTFKNRYHIRVSAGKHLKAYRKYWLAEQ